MDIIPMLLKEMDQETETTRKMLSRVPDDKFDWKPHEKSMTLKQLATHIAEIPSWVAMTLATSELDFATQPYKPTPVESTADVVSLLEKSVSEGRAALAQTNEEQLLQIWTLRSGEHILVQSTKVEMIRHCFSQVVHHRAQLGVYLRLLNVAIPGSYGPSADDMSF